MISFTDTEAVSRWKKDQLRVGFNTVMQMSGSCAYSHCEVACVGCLK